MIDAWLDFATFPQNEGPGHLLGAYGDEKSWALMYNVYADKLLGTGMLSESVSWGQLYMIV